MTAIGKSYTLFSVSLWKTCLHEIKLSEGCLIINYCISTGASPDGLIRKQPVTFISLLLLAEYVFTNESFQIPDMFGRNRYEAKVKGNVQQHLSLSSIRLVVVI